MRATLETLLRISFYAGLIPSLVFVVLYGIRSAWRETSTGRAIMLLMGIIALSYLLGVIGLIWPRFFQGDYALWIALVIRIAIAFVLINLTIVLIRTQNDDRRDREDSKR